MLSHANEIKRLRKVNIVLDPGHGGRDSGAMGYRYFYEKLLCCLTRKIGFYLSNPDINVSYTRYNDVFVPLRTRLDIARSKADLFVSIHADAYMNGIVIDLYLHYRLQERVVRRLDGLLIKKIYLR